MLNSKSLILVFVVFAQSARSEAAEQLIGEELIQPGVAVSFACAGKKEVSPGELNLAKEKADFHLLARVNWSKDANVLVPGNAPRGGFVPFLRIAAQITNQTTGRTSFVSLIPQVNMADNLHYARNTALPGSTNDKYDVKLFVSPPDKFELSFHKDWKGAHGAKLFGSKEYTYGNVVFACATEE